MSMSTPQNKLAPGIFFLVFTIAIGIGWRMAKEGSAHVMPRVVHLVVQNNGPSETGVCGPLGVSLPPPAFDSPYGLHLYATNAPAVVRPLPAMQIIEQLGVPHSSTNSAVAPATGGVVPNETGLDDVQSVGMMLEEFRRAFGAMPVGELNDEIVRRLQGENPKGIAVLPKKHPAISADGELLDRWGTPFRFHPESAWVMTVRSAGPDKKMWTSDDILTDHLDEGNLAVNR